jgi:methylated-DNA-[protein]-cysteine S-methyltransferase
VISTPRSTALRTTVLVGMSVPTPAGPLALVTDADVVVASGFTGVADQFGRLPESVRDRGLRETDPAGPVVDAVRAYLDGDAAALDRVEVAQPGGDFLQDAWAAMRRIPSGRTWSYAELAAEAGRPKAIRAAGSACARNMVAPFVPCHRVVRSDGTLGGYYYGLAVKRWLLAHERGEPVQMLIA